MTRVLAIDGGQTGLRATATGVRAVLDAPGVARLGGDADTAVATAAIRLWRELGSPRVDLAVLGLTTAPSEPAARDALAERVAQACGCSRVIVCDDAIIAHVGALGGEDGISLTVGTGIACIATAPPMAASEAPATPSSGSGAAPQTIARVDGHGVLLDDAGGAYWIGRAGLRAVLRAADGRGARTWLSESAAAAFGPIDRLADTIHDRPGATRAIADFARSVMACDGTDDVATGILDAAAAELCGTARTALRRITDGTAQTGTPVPLALGGGVLQHRRLVRRIEAGLAGAEVAIRPAEADPLGGALLVGAGVRPESIRPRLHFWEGPAS